MSQESAFIFKSGEVPINIEMSSFLSFLLFILKSNSYPLPKVQFPFWNMISLKLDYDILLEVDSIH